jgi:predicted permease
MAWMEDVTRDVRVALRTLAASPGFAAVAVLSLALGIGAATAVFSLANAILLRSLPVPSPGDLRVLRWSAAEARVRSFDGAADSRPGDQWANAESVSAPLFLALRDRARPDADIFGFFPLRNAATVANGQAFVADGMMVSDNFLAGLQVRPVIGRLLQPGEDFSGTQAGVVIANDWWTRYFGRDPGVVGRAITINGRTFTIVGVLAPGFTGVHPGVSCGFYVPLAPGSPFLYTAITNDWHWFVRLMARVGPHASDERLAARLGSVMAGETASVARGLRVAVEAGRAGLGYDRAQFARPLALMLAVIGLVLLSACANLGGLLLVRGTGRRHEMALRAALGGSRRRLFQQALAESLVLAALGSALGVVLAVWGRGWLAGLLAGRADGLQYDLSLDATVLAFSLLLAFVSALLAGVLPALRAMKAEPMDALRSRGALAVPRPWTARSLVVLQVGLALVVLTTAALFVRTVANLTRLDAGFRVDRLLMATVNLRGGAEADADPARFYERAEEAISRLPGVEAASLLDFPLLGAGGSTGSFVWSAGGATGTDMQVRRLRVGESFFATLGVPIVAGRGIQGADTLDSPKVVVVNERFVRRYLPGRDPIGVAFRMWDADWRIVGICRDIKYDSVREPSPPTAYFPYKQMLYSRFRATHLRGASIAARTSVSPLTLADEVRRAIAAIDPGVAVTAITTQEEVRDRGFAQEILLATLSVGLSALTLFLCCVGLFGLMAYTVSRRAGEIGLRVALGATRRDVTTPILREVLLLAAAGIALGLPLSIALARAVGSQLFGVTPADPASFGVAIAALTATALASAWLPARRAQRIEPTEALRLDG